VESIFYIRANEATAILVAIVRAFVLPEIVVVTETDETIPTGAVLIDTFEGKWNGRVVVARDEVAFNRRFWTWAVATAPEQMAFFPRHEASLAFILGDDDADFTPDPDLAP
jgi:hypothetical protein